MVARYAIVADGIVINVAVGEEEFALEQGWLPIPDGYGIGARWDGEEFSIPSPAAQNDPQLALHQIACARLVIDGFDVTGIERSQGLSLAFVVDTDMVWAFFDEPQPDTEYVVIPNDGVTKTTDYLEISRPGLSAINLLIQRVQ